jgi:hypothetical protein
LAIIGVKKGKILKCEKGPNKDQIFKENFPKLSKFWNIMKCCIFCRNFAKKVLKKYYFTKIKIGQKSFCFWQTVSKRPNKADLALKKAECQPCVPPCEVENWARLSFGIVYNILQLLILS